MRLTDLVELDVVQREFVDRLQTGHGGDGDPVELGHRTTELTDEHGAGGLELVVPQDPTGDRLPLDEAGDQCDDAVIALDAVDHPRCRDATRFGRFEDVAFDPHLTLGLSLLALGDHPLPTHRRRPGLPGRTAGESLQTRHLVVAEHGPEHLFDAIPIRTLHRARLAYQQAAARTDGYGFTGTPPSGRISKWRWGMPVALPVSPR